VERVEFGGVFIGEDEGAGAKAVTQVIKAGPGFTRGGAGTGGLLRVAAISRDLFFGGHNVTFFLPSEAK